MSKGKSTYLQLEEQRIKGEMESDVCLFPPTDKKQQKTTTTIMHIVMPHRLTQHNPRNHQKTKTKQKILCS